eukprot:403374591
MRIIERLQYLSGYLFVFSGLAAIIEVQYFLYSVAIVLILVGFFIEGLRLHQVPHILNVFCFGPLCVLPNDYQLVFQIIFMCLTGLSSFALVYGESDYANYKFYGPYKVGFKMIRTQTFDNEMAVYYPVDHDVYEKKKNSKDKLYFIDPKNEIHFLRGLLRSMMVGMKPYKRNVPKFIYQYIKGAFVDVVKNVPISNDFKNGSKELVPIVFSHGLSSCSNYHNLMLADYASHGYLVLAINHGDNSCAFTIGKDGKPYYFDCKPKLEHFETRNNQLKVREQEMKAIIEEVYSKVDILCRIGLGPLKIASDKIVAMGHSFGGITAVHTAKADGRVKAILAYDPWMYLAHGEASLGMIKLERPLLTVMTEHFGTLSQEYNQWESIKHLHQHNYNKKGENIMLKTAYHNDQTDFTILAPLEMQIIQDKRLPRTDRGDIYFLNNQLGLQYLAKLGFANCYSVGDIEKRIKNLKKTYASYDMQFIPEQHQQQPDKTTTEETTQQQEK